MEARPLQFLVSDAEGNTYWLMLTVRNAIPKPQPLATAEFTTLRLLRVAGRITKTATWVGVAFAAARSEAELFCGVARSLQLSGPWPPGPSPPDQPFSPTSTPSIFGSTSR